MQGFTHGQHNFCRFASSAAILFFAWSWDWTNVRSWRDVFWLAVVLAWYGILIFFGHRGCEKCGSSRPRAFECDTTRVSTEGKIDPKPL